MNGTFRRLRVFSKSIIRRWWAKEIFYANGFRQQMMGEKTISNPTTNPPKIDNTASSHTKVQHIYYGFSNSEKDRESRKSECYHCSLVITVFFISQCVYLASESTEKICHKNRQLTTKMALQIATSIHVRSSMARYIIFFEKKKKI